MFARGERTTVTDFDPRSDVINISQTIFATGALALAAASNDGSGNVILRSGANVLLILDTQIGSINETSFDF